MPLKFIRHIICDSCIHLKEYTKNCTYDCFRNNDFAYYDDGKGKKGVMELC